MNQRDSKRTDWMRTGLYGVRGYQVLAFMAYASGLSALLILLSPQQFGDLSPAVAIAFWSSHVFGLLLCSAGILKVLEKLGLNSPKIGHLWARVVAAAVLGAIAFAPLALVIDHALRVAAPDDSQFQVGLVGELVDEAFGLIPFSLVGWTILFGLLQITRQATERAAETAALQASEDTERSLTAKAAANNGTPITTDTGFRAPDRATVSTLVSVVAEQHYARFHYTDGDDLILGSMKEIEDSLAPLAGIRAHRSAWLNPRFVANIRASGSAFEASMTHGPDVPIARRRVADVRTAFTQWRGKI